MERCRAGLADGRETLKYKQLRMQGFWQRGDESIEGMIGRGMEGDGETRRKDELRPYRRCNAIRRSASKGKQPTPLKSRMSTNIPTIVTSCVGLNLVQAPLSGPSHSNGCAEETMVFNLLPCFRPSCPFSHRLRYTSVVPRPQMLFSGVIRWS